MDQDNSQTGGSNPLTDGKQQPAQTPAEADTKETEATPSETEAQAKPEQAEAEADTKETEATPSETEAQAKPEQTEAEAKPTEPEAPAQPEAKPAETQPAQPAEAEAKPEAEAPAQPEAKPAETQPAQPAEAEAKPEAEAPAQPAEAEAKPTEAEAPAQPEAKPAEVQPAEPAAQPEAAQPAQPEAQPEATTTAQAPATSEECGCPTINEAEWDKQKKTIDKAFYKTWSPRLMYYPFSFAIDVARAKTGAKNANYTVPENPMILDTGGRFWSSVMVEITGEKAEDKNVVSLKGKEVYTKVSKRPWNEIKTDIDELKKELGKEPSELYLWYTACPKCMDKKEVKTVLIAVQ